MSKKRKVLPYERKKNISYTIFLIPFLAGFFLVFLGVYFDSVRLSFSSVEMKGAEGFALHFVKFANYKHIFTIDPDYLNNLYLSVGETVFNVAVVTLYSLLMAVVLNSKIKGRAAFRAIFFIPVILATGFIDKADIQSAILTQQWDSIGAVSNETSTVANGLISSREIARYLMELNFSPMLQGWVIRAIDSIFNIVNLAGVQMMIFLAGLQSISPSIYEAADVDGSSRWESFWLITFPMISPIILVNVIYTIVDSLTKPKNLIMQMIDKAGLAANSMGQSAAMAWFYFLIIGVFILIITFILQKYIYYQQRD